MSSLYALLVTGEISKCAKRVALITVNQNHPINSAVTSQYSISHVESSILYSNAHGGS